MPYWLDRVNLGTFNTHLGLVLGGGIAVVLGVFALGRIALGILFWPLILLGVLGVVGGLLGMTLDGWRAWGGARPRTTAATTDPQRALVVSLIDEQWRSFQHKARFLLINYRIRNRTRVPIQTENYQLEIVGLHIERDVDVSRERERLRREFREPLSVVPAGKAVEGWHVVELQYGPGEGDPEYRFLLHSAKGGHQYGFKRFANPKRTI
jgi:hypothetical protein